MEVTYITLVWNTSIAHDIPSSPQLLALMAALKDICHSDLPGQHSQVFYV